MNTTRRAQSRDETPSKWNIRIGFVHDTNALGSDRKETQLTERNMRIYFILQNDLHRYCKAAVDAINVKGLTS